MIYQLRFSVVADTLLPEVIQRHIGGYNFDLIPDENGSLSRMYIGKPVTDFHEFLPIMGDSTSHLRGLSVPANPYFDEIIDLAQYIEAMGSFWFGIEKIDWNSPEIVWVPTADDEHELIKANHLRVERRYEKERREFNLNILSKLLRKRATISDLIIPMSFYREARREFASFRYINAFYNYYFILEDLFGNGQTKNYRVEEQFKKSELLMECIDGAVSVLDTPGNRRHFNDIESRISSKNLTWDAEGVASFIVRMRGDLHHFSQKSTKPQGHPLNQADYESVAFLMMAICTNVYVKSCEQKGFHD